MLVDAVGRPLGRKLRVAMDAKQVRWFGQWDDLLKPLGLVIKCARCGEIPVGDNHPQAATLKVECGCAVRVYNDTH